MILQGVLSPRFYYWNMKYIGVKNSKKKRMWLETEITSNSLIMLLTVLEMLCLRETNSQSPPPSTWRAFCSSSVVYVIKSMKSPFGRAPWATHSVLFKKVHHHQLCFTSLDRTTTSPKALRSTDHAANTEPPMSVRRFRRSPSVLFRYCCQQAILTLICKLFSPNQSS